jgi:hypothetical protein
LKIIPKTKNTYILRLNPKTLKFLKIKANSDDNKIYLKIENFELDEILRFIVDVHKNKKLEIFCLEKILVSLKFLSPYLVVLNLVVMIISWIERTMVTIFGGKSGC